MGFKVSQIGTAGSMAVLVLVLESMAANAGFEIHSLTNIYAMPKAPKRADSRHLGI